MFVAYLSDAAPQNTMLTRDFSYRLPKKLIAQYPSAERGGDRLLVVGPSGRFRDAAFRQLPDYLQAGDLIVLNDTRVLPARLFARKETGGKVEIMLERICDEKRLLAQLHGARSLAPGALLQLDDNISLRVVERRGRLFLLDYAGKESLTRIFERLGHVPLPPYINRDDNNLDRERYQTVFAEHPGAVAAPTAGLHFSEEILKTLATNGIDNVRLTLHIGAGTFQPVRVDNITEHHMHKEYMNLSDAAVDRIRATKNNGGRIIAVGTTVVRGLETAAQDGVLKAYRGDTDIFIYPGFHFNIVDMILTNFHLPESTLLMLVCAFSGKNNIMAAYQHAIDKEYRFYSYGDGMLLTGRAERSCNSTC